MTRLILMVSLVALTTLPSAASSGPYDLIIADSIDLTLCENGCGITLAGLDYGLIVNTGTTDITLSDLRNSQFTATSSQPAIRLFPFINIPNEQLVGAIHPGEAVGSVVDGNQLLLPLLKPGETLRNLAFSPTDGVQFMAYQVDRLGPYVGPVDFQVRMKLAGQVAMFTIHAEVSSGPHAIRFLSASRVSSSPSSGDPNCSAAMASPARVWPPSGQLVPIDITGLTDPDGDPVTVTITGITQDEEVGGAHGSTQRGGRQAAPSDSGGRPPNGDRRCPDAEIIDGKAYVRAERDASGNGRVYVLNFNASDGLGGECAGSVAVCVPHDRGHGSACVDDGQQFNALDCSPESLTTTPVAASSLISAMFVQDGKQLRYSLLKDSEIEMELYDIAGRRIATLDQGARSAGEHTLNWDDHARPKGVYFVRMRVDGQTEPGAVIRIRN